MGRPPPRTRCPVSATPYQQLEQEWKRLHAFRGALALLRWDAAVMMPKGSADIAPQVEAGGSAGSLHGMAG